MNLFSVFLLALALSMDAFAVSLCKGFGVPALRLKHFLIVGGVFGGFQALVPLLGYLVGVAFEGFVKQFDHWIAFVLLVFIGGKMIKEGRQKGANCENLGGFGTQDFGKQGFGAKEMLLLAFATSIDAFAVGVGLAFLRVEIVWTLLIFGLTAFVLCCAALKIGNVFGVFLQNKAEILGGAVLVGLGFKILLEHLFFS